MKTFILNRPHLQNIFWTAVVFLVVGMLGPIGGAEVINTVRTWSLVLDTGSPYPTSSHYYHPGDRMDIQAQRYANFEATVESARLLRRINVGTTVDDVADAKVLPLTAIERGPHGLIFHPVLPDPLPAGRYYYIFPGKFTIYNRVHNLEPRSVDFEVVPKEVPIVENMPPFRP